MELGSLTTVYLNYQTAQPSFNYDNSTGTCKNMGEYVSNVLGEFPVCVQCAKGQYGVEINIPKGKRKACRQCPTGKYLDQVAQGSNVCVACPKGRYGSARGAVASVLCALRIPSW